MKGEVPTTSERRCTFGVRWSEVRRQATKPIAKGRATTIFFSLRYSLVFERFSPYNLVMSDKGKKRILIVEDERAIGTVISEALLDQGYESCWVGTVNEAFKAIKSFSPHLVIINYEMPNLTGLEFLKELRKQEIYINVIVMSGRSDTNVIVDVFQSGADDFIRKPFRFQEFFVRIGSSLKNNDLHRDLLEANKKLKKLVDLDYLTGLYNMRSMYDKIDMQLRRVRPFQSYVSCIMLDMDDFKSVNDQNDHLFGSFVIKEVGKLISQAIREIDFAARYGGDEFLIVLTDIQVDGVGNFCERLRKTIGRYHFKDGDNETNLTVSLGYVVSGGDSDANARELVRRADHALYEAKKSGKNTTVKFRLKKTADTL